MKKSFKSIYDTMISSVGFLNAHNKEPKNPIGMLTTIPEITAILALRVPPPKNPTTKTLVNKLTIVEIV